MVEPRPKSVVIVAAFLFAATGLAAIVGLSLLFPNPLMDRLWELNRPGQALFQRMGRGSGVLLLAVGAATFVIARSLLAGKKWAWLAAIGLFLIDAAGDAISTVITNDWWRFLAGVVISGTFIAVLIRNPVRRWIQAAR